MHQPQFVILRLPTKIFDFLQSLRMTWVLQLFQEGEKVLDDFAEFRAFWGYGAVLVQVFCGELSIEAKWYGVFLAIICRLW